MNRYSPQGPLQTLSYAFSFSRLRWRHQILKLLGSNQLANHRESRSRAASDSFNRKYIEYENIPFLRRFFNIFLRSLPRSIFDAPNLTVDKTRIKRSVFEIEGPDHDLSRYRIHSDQKFGGSSWAEIKFGECQKIVETFPGSGEFEQKKVRTIIFYGELKPVKPWTEQQQRQIDTGFLKRFNIRTAKNFAPLEEEKKNAGEIGGERKIERIAENSSSSSPYTSSSNLAQSNALIQSRFQFPGVPQSDRNSVETFYSADALEKSVRKTGNIPPPAGHFHGCCSFFSPNFAWPDLDLSTYDFLKVNMRTDGRQYFFNLKSMPFLDNLYQVRVPAEKPRPLHTKEVRFTDFIEVFEGEMTKFPDSRLALDQITSFGISVSGPAGPFEVEIESIEAFRGIPDYEREKVDSAMTDDTQFERNKDKNVFWWLTPEERSRFGSDNEYRTDVDDSDQVRKRYRKWLERKERKIISDNSKSNQPALENNSMNNNNNNNEKNQKNNSSEV